MSEITYRFQDNSVLELLYRSSIACILSCYVISYFYNTARINMTSSSKNDYDKTGFTYITSKLLPRWSLYTRYEYVTNIFLLHILHIYGTSSLTSYRCCIQTCIDHCYVFSVLYVLALYVFIIVYYYSQIINQLNSSLCNN